MPVTFPGKGYCNSQLFTSCSSTKLHSVFQILYTDKKEIQSGAVAKSYMRKGFLIYEEMRKYFSIYEEAVSHIHMYDFATAPF
jgi:hypothetical protein